MDGEQRRQEIINILSSSAEPVSASKMAAQFHVSRPVIVQDVALLRAGGRNIIATNKGYVINEGKRFQRIFQVIHNDDQIEDELTTIVDLGGRVIDVFVDHKLYGEFRGTLFITSRKDVRDFILQVAKEKVSPLKQLTDEYHYHTIEADSEEILDLIYKALAKKKYLVN